MAACFQVMNMTNTHCSADAKHIRRFLNTCQGNWHNCIYVNCASCKTPGFCREPGFLFHPDEKGVPCILPFSDARILFARVPEPAECLSVLTTVQFLSLYRDFLKSHHFPDGYCPCISLLHTQEAACYDW